MSKASLPTMSVVSTSARSGSSVVLDQPRTTVIRSAKPFVCATRAARSPERAGGEHQVGEAWPRLGDQHPEFTSIARVVSIL
jgi:hypothetical protein